MGVIGFYFFGYDNSVYFSSEGVDYCSTPLSCFATILMFVIPLGGALQQAFGAPTLTFGLKWYQYFGVVYYTFNFIIFGAIYLNTFFAIIVDTFGAIRDTRNDFRQYKTSFCFVCALEKEEIHKKSKLTEDNSPFETHINNHHNKWNYFKFYLYLRLKYESYLSDQKSFVGYPSFVEIDVIERIHEKKKSLMVFPINKGKNLKEKEKKSNK